MPDEPKKPELSFREIYFEDWGQPLKKKPEPKKPEPNEQKQKPEE